MEPIKDIAKKWQKQPIERNKYLHSADHLLADQLSQQFNDKKHFGFYLKMATTYPHGFLLKIAGDISENPNVKTPGKLFAYLIKKHNQEIKSKKN